MPSGFNSTIQSLVWDCGSEGGWGVGVGEKVNDEFSKGIISQIISAGFHISTKICVSYGHNGLRVYVGLKFIRIEDIGF
jgi:hypothetical protein